MAIMIRLQEPNVLKELMEHDDESSFRNFLDQTEMKVVTTYELDPIVSSKRFTKTSCDCIAWEDFATDVDTQHYRDYNYGIGNYDHGHRNC